MKSPISYKTISIPLWYDYKYKIVSKTGKNALFQFHYGTIISQYPAAFGALPPVFQFHYGTIISTIFSYWLAGC